MLLTVDIGNTNIKFALYDYNKKVSFLMLDSKLIDFKSFILSFLYKANIRETQIEDTIIASVVPVLTTEVTNSVVQITNKQPHIISSKNCYGIKIAEDWHEEIGADLLVMCAYAYQMLRKELFVISFGTATVINHVSIDGVFAHAVLAPGFLTLAGTLYKNGALLPEFLPQKEKTFLPTDTLTAMNVGVVDGYIGMIKYLLTCMKTELNSQPTIIACGGNGKQIVPYFKEIQSYDPDMVTEGLNYIYNRYIRYE